MSSTLPVGRGFPLLRIYAALVLLSGAAAFLPNLSRSSPRISTLLPSCSYQGWCRRSLLPSNPRVVTRFAESEEGGDIEPAPAPAPSKIDNILKDLHSQGFPFRIVVIGNGAILETTSVLGPHMAESTSPKTGERLITLASDDRSFEFHLKIDQVGKVTFTSTDRQVEGGGKKKLRICRMLNHEGGPICSLILAESSEEAADWFKSMTIRYGYEVHAGD